MTDKITIDGKHSGKSALWMFVSGLIVSGVGLILLPVGFFGAFGQGPLPRVDEVGWCLLAALLLATVGVALCFVALSKRRAFRIEQRPDVAAPDVLQRTRTIYVAGVIGVASGVILTGIGLSGGWLTGFEQQPWYSPGSLISGMLLFCLGVIGCLVALVRFVRGN